MLCFASPPVKHLSADGGATIGKNVKSNQTPSCNFKYFQDKSIIHVRLTKTAFKVKKGRLLIISSVACKHHSNL